MAPKKIIIDVYAAMSIIDHCKRAALFYAGSNQEALGSLLGEFTNEGAIITSYRPNREGFNIDPRLRSIGVYSFGSPITEVLHGASRSVWLQVTLSSPENMKLKLNAYSFCGATGASESKPGFELAEVVVEARFTEANVVMASCMSDLFPEVRTAMSCEDPLAVDYIAYDRAFSCSIKEEEGEFDSPIDSQQYATRINKQMSILSKIVDAVSSGKKKALDFDLEMGKTATRLAEEVHQLIDKLQLNRKGTVELQDNIKDAVLLKYIAHHVQRKIHLLQTLVKKNEDSKRQELE